MYSKKIEAALKKARVRVGDRVVVGHLVGLLMPSPDVTGSPSHVVLKLDNGYNVGIEYAAQKIEKAKSKEPARVQKQYDFEVKDQHVHIAEACKPGVPTIALFSTGGTITSKVDYKTGGVSTKASAEDLYASVPELKRVACFSETKTVLEVMSEDMGWEDWAKMTKECVRTLKNSEGVVLTHGTDALHYTSAALSFMLQDLGKPVVLTGSQRSTDRGSADSAMNLICSVVVAGSNFSGVGTCMHGSPNDDYCYFLRGTKVRKMHSSERAAFKPVNDYPLAKVFPDGKVKDIRGERRKKSTAKADTKFEPKVAFLKAAPGIDPKTVEFAVKNGAKGIVIEGMGLGHVPTQGKNSWIPKIKSVVKSGVPVCVAPQTLYGSLHPDVYSNLRILYHDAGAVNLKDMLPETAYIKLGWVLGHTNKPDKVKELMLTNIAGEFNPKLSPGMFLFK